MSGVPEDSRAEASRAAPASLPVAGTVWGGRYRLAEQLGRGGMGAVFRALDVQAGREVALKLMANGLSGAQRERFRREGQLTAALRHPGILRVHEAGEIDGLPYLAYELLPRGQDLEQLIAAVAAGTRPRAEGLARLLEAAQALGYAHSQGVVHRDVKPANVLIDAAGRARVADFGLARAEDSDRLTASGALVGTPSYMAPEQFLGRSVGPSADVWSLGVILYQLLAGGALPWQCETLLELSARVVQADLDPPSQLDPTAPEALEAVCLRALRADPRERYPDAEAMARDLELAIEEGRVGRDPGRRRLRRALALLGLTLLLGLAGVGALSAGRARALRRLLEAAPRDPAARAALEEAWEGLPPGATRDRAARILAESAPDPAAELRWAERALAAGADLELQRRRAGALLALDRPAEAARALADDPADSAAALELRLRVRLAAGEFEAACEDAARLTGLAPDPEHTALALEAWLAAGDVAGARAVLEGGDPAPWRALLAADLSTRLGEDPTPQLQAALLRWPEDAALREEAGRAWLAAGEPELALACVLRGVGAATGSGDEALRELTRALRAGQDPRPALARLPAAWAEAAAGCELALARLEAAFSRERPRPPLLTPRPLLRHTPEARRARAEARLERTLALAHREHVLGQAWLELAWLRRGGARAAALREAAVRLRPRPPLAAVLRAELLLERGDPARALAALPGAGLSPPAALEASLLRARALLRLGLCEPARLACEAGEALDPYEPTLPELRGLALDALARGEAAAAARLRAARLRGSELEASRELALRVHVELKEGSVRERLALLDQALELYPPNVEAHMFHAKLSMRGAEEEERLAAAREMARALEWAPDLYAREITEDGRSLASGWRGSSTPLGQLANAWPAPQDPVDFLTLGFLREFQVEYELNLTQVQPGIEALDAHLRAHPPCALSWCLRGFLHLRAGHRAEARRDLAIGAEAAPEVGAFYWALLLAAEGVPHAEVLAALEEGYRLGVYPLDVNTAGIAYPELGPYLARPSFRDRLKTYVPY